MEYINPPVSEICDPQSLDPICGKFDKFLAHGQAHMGPMGKWPWQCTTTGLDNSTEHRMEKIRQAVTEIWVPQVWQPPARPPARTVTTIPLQPEGLMGKKDTVGLQLYVFLALLRYARATSILSYGQLKYSTDKIKLIRTLIIAYPKMSNSQPSRYLKYISKIRWHTDGEFYQMQEDTAIPSGIPICDIQ